MKKLYIRTFGCQMNEYDSAKMADVLDAAGKYEKTDDPAQADVILFNTCSVRENSHCSKMAQPSSTLHGVRSSIKLPWKLN